LSDKQGTERISMHNEIVQFPASGEQQDVKVDRLTPREVTGIESSTKPFADRAYAAGLNRLFRLIFLIGSLLR
jgi:hypothetical protein